MHPTMQTVAAVIRRVWHAFVASYVRALDDMDQFGFPAVIRFCVYTLSIVFDLLLIPILIIFSSEVAIVLIANTYLNAMSSALGKINLRQQIEEHGKTRAIAQASHDHAAETHRLTAEIHQHLGVPTNPTSGVSPSP